MIRRTPPQSVYVISLAPHVQHRRENQGQRQLWGRGRRLPGDTHLPLPVLLGVLAITLGILSLYVVILHWLCYTSHRRVSVGISEG